MDCVEAENAKGKAANVVEPLDANNWRIAEDVVECIVERLALCDLCSLRLCSQFFCSVCSSDHIWIQLFKQRWPCLPPKDHDVPEDHRMLECTLIRPCSLHVLYKLPNQRWQEAYASLHTEMAANAKSVIDFVKTRSRNESVEVYDYQKAMALLSDLGFGFHDVLMYLLTPTQGVLLNLIGVHFSFIRLRIQCEDVKAALKRNGLGTRQLCLRWWTMGAWAAGYRRRDEMHICTVSMDQLLGSTHRFLLDVMERGRIHEVLRVQISADFKTSAWVSRDMHSHR